MNLFLLAGFLVLVFLAKAQDKLLEMLAIFASIVCDVVTYTVEKIYTGVTWLKDKIQGPAEEDF